MPEDDATLLDLLLATQRAMEGLGQLTAEQLASDWKAQSIVIRQLLILGEAVKRLTPEFRTANPGIPWKKIAGLRDVLIHSYDAVDVEAVHRIVTKDLQPHLGFFKNVQPKG